MRICEPQLKTILYWPRARSCLERNVTQQIDRKFLRCLNSHPLRALTQSPSPMFQKSHNGKRPWCARRAEGRLNFELKTHERPLARTSIAVFVARRLCPLFNASRTRTTDASTSPNSHRSKVREGTRKLSELQHGLPELDRASNMREAKIDIVIPRRTNLGRAHLNATLNVSGGDVLFW